MPTDVMVTYDDAHLYVAWRCHDPSPGQIRAHLMDRDSIDTLIQDDHVVLSLDTFNDERRAFQFRVNPLGVQADAFNSESEGIEDWAFDLIWDAAGRITATGYIVEIAIPFNQLRFPRDDMEHGLVHGRHGQGPGRPELELSAHTPPDLQAAEHIRKHIHGKLPRVRAYGIEGAWTIAKG